MPRKTVNHPLLGQKKVPPSNADVCPACGSHCSRTEADRARSMIDGAKIEQLSSQLKAAQLRIEAMELEANAARPTKRAGEELED